MLPPKYYLTQSLGTVSKYGGGVVEPLALEG